MPCSNNVSERRGKPSVHAPFGERLAVLTGDELIALGFEVLAMAVTQAHAPESLEKLGFHDSGGSALIFAHER